MVVMGAMSAFLKAIARRIARQKNRTGQREGEQVIVSREQGRWVGRSFSAALAVQRPITRVRQLRRLLGAPRQGRRLYARRANCFNAAGWFGQRPHGSDECGCGQSHGGLCVRWAEHLAGKIAAFAVGSNGTIAVVSGGPFAFSIRASTSRTCSGTRQGICMRLVRHRGTSSPYTARA